MFIGVISEHSQGSCPLSFAGQRERPSVVTVQPGRPEEGDGDELW